MCFLSLLCLPCLEVQNAQSNGIETGKHSFTRDEGAFKLVNHTCHNFDHPLEELCHGEGAVELLGALVVLVRLGERRDPHGHRAVHVEQPDDEEAAPQDDPPLKRRTFLVHAEMIVVTG